MQKISTQLKETEISIKSTEQQFFEEQKKILAEYNFKKSKKAAAKKHELPRITTAEKHCSSIDNSLLLEWK